LVHFRAGNFLVAATGAACFFRDVTFSNSMGSGKRTIALTFSLITSFCRTYARWLVWNVTAVAS
jgi:hypothetical protein